MHNEFDNLGSNELMTSHGESKNDEPTSLTGWSFASDALGGEDISCETLVAVETAATRRGWVIPIKPGLSLPSKPNPASYSICGTCVVLPDPVSPGQQREKEIQR